MSEIIARYEEILDGRVPKDVPAKPQGVVSSGPWGLQGSIG
jgi:hypothetical protein